MAPMMTPLDRVQYGVSSCAAWSKQQDVAARAALRHLVAKDSVVAACGEWGYQDGWKDSERHVYVGGHPRHTPIILEELRRVMPDVKFVLDNPGTLLRAPLHTARKIWGDGHVPPPPVGDAYATEWAPIKIVLRQHRPQIQAANWVDDWQTTRMICAMAGVEVPQLLDLPHYLTDAYVARNMGLTDLPEGLVPYAEALAFELFRSLRDLADGRPVLEVARPLHRWLFEES